MDSAPTLADVDGEKEVGNVRGVGIVTLLQVFEVLPSLFLVAELAVNLAEQEAGEVDGVGAIVDQDSAAALGRVRKPRMQRVGYQQTKLDPAGRSPQ